LVTPLLWRTARIAAAALLVFVFLAAQLFSYHSPTVGLLGSGEAARVAVERSGSCRNTTRSNRTANRTMKSWKKTFVALSIFACALVDLRINIPVRAE
jgi:hypothetical protein